MYFKKWKDFIKTNEVNSPITNPSNGTNSAILNTTTPNPTSGTNSATNTPKIDDSTLQEKLNRWNTLYSQEFKFKNNMPNIVKEDSNLEELISNVVSECGGKVREGINKLIDEFKKKEVQDEFNGKELKIIGYTSTTASESYNQKLSLRRAEIVSNSIKNELKKNNIKLNVKFIEDGKGENVDGLIIINDQSLDPIKWGKLAPKFSPEDEKKLLNSKEERQKINRRVIITLPQFENMPVPTKIPNIGEEKIKEVEKPILPKPESIEFNYDSFILKKQSGIILTNFTNDLKKWNIENKDENLKIKNIYISSHTKLGTGGDPSMENNQKNMLAILSANRGQFVKDFIKNRLGEDIAKTINIIVYPVAYEMGKEKKVVINFEKGEHMKDAESKFKTLAETYKLPIKNNSLENLPVYLDNEPLEKSIEFNIKSFSKEGTTEDIECIPLELYYDKLEGYEGFEKYTNFRNKCKDDYTKTINKYNKRFGKNYKPSNFVYAPE